MTAGKLKLVVKGCRVSTMARPFCPNPSTVSSLKLKINPSCCWA